MMLDPLAPGLKDFDEVRQIFELRTAERLAAVRQPPVTRIWDKDHELVGQVFGEIGAEYEDLLNDTGQGDLSLFNSHPMAGWFSDELEEEEDVHITVDAAYWRWHGKAESIEEALEEDGLEYIKIHWLHGFEHAKKIVCFANPFLPAIVQYPKIWAYAGPAATGIKLLLFLNLWRRFSPNWVQLPDNLFDPASWLANLNPANWPQVVNPRNTGLADSSMWTVISTRFGLFYDAVKDTLNDSNLQLTATRWVPGDEQPAPEAFILTKPTIVWDVVDKSGVRGPTGTALDGLLQLVGTIASDYLNEIVEAVNPGDAPDEYKRDNWFGTIPEWPWVCWRSSMYYARERGTGISGVKAWRKIQHKALAGAIVTGGKSPSWGCAPLHSVEGHKPTQATLRKPRCQTPAQRRARLSRNALREPGIGVGDLRQSGRGCAARIPASVQSDPSGSDGSRIVRRGLGVGRRQRIRAVGAPGHPHRYVEHPRVHELQDLRHQRSSLHRRSALRPR